VTTISVKVSDDPISAGSSSRRTRGSSSTSRSTCTLEPATRERISHPVPDRPEPEEPDAVLPGDHQTARSSGLRLRFRELPMFVAM